MIAFLFSMLSAVAVASPTDTGSAPIRFVTPLADGQVIGPQFIEVTTEIGAVDRVEFLVDHELAGIARKSPYRIVYDFGDSLTSHTIDARVSSDHYRSIASAHIQTAAVTAGEVLSVDLVEVPLRLRSSRRVSVRDLRIRENGVEQQARELRPQRNGARFVFIVDRSLSMDGGRLQSALRSIDAAIPQLRADDRVEVLLFNHNVSRARPVASGERLATIFASTVASGGTSLRDAISEVHSEGATYAIVITDGGDRNSRLTEEQALRALSGARTVVYGVILGPGSRFLDRAAANTGGTTSQATAASLPEALGGVLGDINSRYLLIYQSHGAGSGWRRIEISARSRGVTVSNARKEYFAE